MNKTSASILALAFVGALGLTACDKKTPTPSTTETPSAAPMASGPAASAP